MRSVARYSMLLFTAAVVQRFFLDQFRIDDVSADAFLALAVATGMVAGSRRGAIVGFAAGLVFDLLVITPFGLGALSYLVAGAVGGLLEGLVVRSARWLTLLVGFLSGAAGVLFYALLGTLVGSTGLLDGHLPAVIVIVSAWTSVLVVPIRSAVRWADPVTDSFRSAIHS